MSWRMQASDMSGIEVINYLDLALLSVQGKLDPGLTQAAMRRFKLILAIEKIENQIWFSVNRIKLTPACDLPIFTLIAACVILVISVQHLNFR
jgi:hypothetical protein